MVGSEKRAQAFVPLGFALPMMPLHDGFRLFVEISVFERSHWMIVEERLVYSQMVIRVDPGSPNHRDHLRSEWDWPGHMPEPMEDDDSMKCS